MNNNEEKYPIFDSHAHYDDEAFDEDRDSVINELKNNNIVGVLNCGSSVKGSRMSVELAEKYDFIYAAVGIHPEMANELSDEILEEFKRFALKDKVKAIGEIGLDYHCDENPSKKIQKDVFIKQMELAKELNLPVVIHDREAHEDTLNIMKQFKGLKGVVHCFSGSLEFAKECLNLGYYIGFTGVITFKNARKIIDVAKEVPIDRMLIETDCPYLSPVPLRGKRNRSENIKFIVDQIAAVKNMEINEICCKTILNTKGLLNLNY